MMAKQLFPDQPGAGVFKPAALPQKAYSVHALGFWFVPNMQLHQLVLVTAFALWCCCSSTNAEPLGLGINNNPSGLRRFTPLLLRLLRAFRDTNDGYADGVVDDQAATGSTTKAPKYTDSWWPNREQRTITSRQSMECWCAVENCNCDSARIHDGKYIRREHFQGTGDWFVF